MSDFDRFEILRSAEAAEAAKKHQESTGLGLGEYVVDLSKRHGKDQLAAKLWKTAIEFEPPESKRKSVTEGSQVAAAFFAGSLPAVRLAQIYLTAEQRQAMADFKTGITISYDVDSPDFPDIQYASAVAHMELAGQGWDTLDPAFGQLYGEWATRSYNDAHRQEMLRRGCGFVAYLAGQVENAAKMDEIKSLVRLRGAVNWSEGLAAELISPEMPPNSGQ
jgi:hypothetical protein